MDSEAAALHGSEAAALEGSEAAALDGSEAAEFHGSEAAALKRVPAIKGLGQAILEQQPAAPVRTSEGSAQEVSTRFEQVKDAAKEMRQRTVKKVKELQEEAAIIVKEPKFQIMTISTGTGVVSLGTAGGAFGAAAGVVLGSAAGVVPALLTFGLSIPAGALIGGSTGFFSGALIGCTTGAGAGGATGLCIYRYRVEIKNGAVQVKVKVQTMAAQSYEKVNGAVSCAKLAIKDAKESVRAKASESWDLAKAKVSKAAGAVKTKGSAAVAFATSTRTGVTSSSAALGGALGVSTGGTCGMVAGAAVGVVPAVFTFGLSIPISAGIGLLAGAAAGGSMGTVTGAAAGYTGFTYCDDIKRSAGYIRTKTMDSAAQVKQSVRSLVCAGTGETA